MYTNKNSILSSIVILLMFISSCGKNADEPKPADSVMAPAPAPGAPKSLPKTKPSLEDVDDQVRGKIAYDIPDSMEVEHSYTATVAITRSHDNRILFKGIDSAHTETDEIRVSSVMKVKLEDRNGGKYFNITPLSSLEQAVDQKENTVWKWNVEPLASGEHYLHLTAVITIKDSLGITNRDIEVFNRSFLVKNKPLVRRVTTFVGNNWQWFASSLLIPLLAYIFSLMRKRRKEV